MARKSRRIDLDLMRDQLVSSVERQFEETLSNRLKRIRNKVSSEHKNFFKVLSTRMVRKTKPKALGIPGVRAPAWKPLTKRYADRRLRESSGRITRNLFFQSGRKNSLATWFRSANPKTWFGNPTVMYKIGDATTGKDPFEVQYSQRGKGFSKQFIGRRGLPVKRKSIPKKLKGYIVVDPYPFIGGGLMDDSKVEFFLPSGGAFSVQEKLLAQREVYRPYLGYFMIWWMRTKIMKAMRNGI